MTPSNACFQLRRALAAPPHRVWHLLTDPAARATWGPPSADEVLIFDATDLREGGIDHHRCGPREAPEMHVETRWLRLAAPDVASFTETLRRDGHILSVSLVTCALSAEAGGTALLVHVAVSSFAGRDIADAHRTGWARALDNLVTEIPA